MTLALVDVPRCLRVDASYVGSPRALVAAGGDGYWSEGLFQDGTEAHRERAVRECLDTAAILRDYIPPAEGETWLIPAASERRLLAQVNVIIALGPLALDHVRELALDPDVPDPGRVFAVLMVLGCVEDHDWFLAARDLFIAASARHPDEATAATEALSLCPHAELPAVFAPLLTHETPSIRGGVIRILSRRGRLTESAWTSALEDRDPAVIGAALDARLGGYDRRVCEQALQPFYERATTEALVRLALRAGLSLRLGSAHDRAVEIVRSDPAWADALTCLAMFGRTTDVGLFREVLHGPYPELGLDPVTILGCAELVPDLLDLLDVTGLSPEVLLRAKRALTVISGEAFDEAATSAEARGLWSRVRSRLKPGRRYRNGRLLTLEAQLQSLRGDYGSREGRENVYLDMMAATEARVPPFSAYDFVGTQLEALRHIEHWLAETAGR